MFEDIEKADGKCHKNFRYNLGTGNGKVNEIIFYSQLVDHLEATVNEESKINDDLYELKH